MFHPRDRPMQRGWVGRVDGHRVVHLAAQTLQSYFAGGGGAREHDVYDLAGVALLAPVLHPPTVRIFETQDAFAFANAAAVTGPEAAVVARGPLLLLPRLTAVVGEGERPGGYTLLAEIRAPGRPIPKDRDFALVTGPVVVTPDALDPGAVAAVVRTDAGGLPTTPAPPFDWALALALARDGTELRTGDLVAGPAFGEVPVATGAVEVEVEPIGVLGLSLEEV